MSGWTITCGIRPPPIHKNSCCPVGSQERSRQLSSNQGDGLFLFGCRFFGRGFGWFFAWCHRIFSNSVKGYRLEQGVLVPCLLSLYCASESAVLQGGNGMLWVGNKTEILGCAAIASAPSRPDEQPESVRQTQSPFLPDAALAGHVTHHRLMAAFHCRASFITIPSRVAQATLASFILVKAPN
jgi:hypothetical protein